MFDKMDISMMIKVVEIIEILEIKIRFCTKGDYVDNSMVFLLYIDLVYGNKYI